MWPAINRAVVKICSHGQSDEWQMEHGGGKDGGIGIDGHGQISQRGADQEVDLLFETRVVLDCFDHGE